MPNDERIIRVFPQRTSATPIDDLAFVGDPPLFLPKGGQVHISCVFTWDKPEADRLARAWASHGYDVQLGGPAYDARGDEFEPGVYVKDGMTITSRGCIRRCPFCFVPQREGTLRLLDIKPGWDVLDNNLLACPRSHIETVLDMLNDQPRAARFTGGIDARLCRPWFAKRLGKMRVKILYTAYDLPLAKQSVERTIAMLRDASLRRWQVGCYVLVGYVNDTTEAAEDRLQWVLELGGTPFAMFYLGPESRSRKIPDKWRALVRKWIRPAAIFATPDGARETCTEDYWHRVKKELSL